MNLRFSCFMAAIFLLAVGCNRESNLARSGTELRVLCGSSMATPGQTISKLFTEKQGAQVLVDLGGSETLLLRILTEAAADIFICHAPFEQKIKEAGLWSGSAKVGLLQPVLVVRPGNPSHLQSANDLTNRDLKIGIGDPRYSTCGELFLALLDRKGIRQEVMKQVVLQGRTHAEIANGLILGSLDVAVVWNYIAVLYKGKAELVTTSDSYPEINVTVVGLKQSQNPSMRNAFLEFCRSQEVRDVFGTNGYVASLPPLR